MKEVLSENNIKYMYVDICEGVGKLKSFLKVRDTAPEMQEVREQHRAGIPCLVVDDQVILVNGAEHMQQLIEQYQLKEDLFPLVQIPKILQRKESGSDGNRVL